MKHIIQQQRFEITASTARLMHAWEGRAQGILNDVINPAAERCFNETSHTDEIIIIDTLEIDLGILNELTHRQIIDKVTSSLMLQLNGRKHSAPSSLTKERSAGNIAAETDLKTVSKHASIAESFIYFLLHGRLPWWVTTTDQINFKSDWIERLSATQTNLVAQTLSTNSYTLDRLVYQFDDTFIVALLTYYNSSLATTIALAWHALKNILPANQDEASKVRYAYWRYWAEKCINISSEESKRHEPFTQWITQPAVTNQLRTWLELPGADVNRDVPSPIKTGPYAISTTERNALFYVLKIVSPEILEPNRDLDKSSEVTKNKNTTQEDSVGDRRDNDLPIHQTEQLNKPSDRESEIQQRLAAHTDIPKTASVKNNKQTQNDERVYADKDVNLLYTEAAGLVLVHPFLTELFRSTTLWNNNGWTSPAAQHRAVKLVTWLAFGTTETPEHQLIIPKLLCSMPWEEPLDTTAEITEDNLHSANQLLEAIITHWKALGKTSIDGLREGFIHREGKLTRRDDGWLLIIESKAQDILVSRLPWGVSLIHLPWHGKMNIHVQWT